MQRNGPWDEIQRNSILLSAIESFLDNSEGEECNTNGGDEDNVDDKENGTYYILEVLKVVIIYDIQGEA